jgi:hypothetical protein
MHDPPNDLSNWLKVIAVSVHAIEALGGGERRYSSCSSLTWVLGGVWSALRPGRALALGKGHPGTHWTRGWVGPKASLDTEARGNILSLCEPRSPSRSARSQLLYRLSYPGSLQLVPKVIFSSSKSARS